MIADFLLMEIDQLCTLRGEGVVNLTLLIFHNLIGLKGRMSLCGLALRIRNNQMVLFPVLISIFPFMPRCKFLRFNRGCHPYEIKPLNQKRSMMATWWSSVELNGVDSIFMFL